MNSNDLQADLSCPCGLFWVRHYRGLQLPILLQCNLICPAGYRVLRAAPPSREAPPVLSRQAIAHSFKLRGVATVPGGATFVSSRASFGPRRVTGVRSNLLHVSIHHQWWIVTLLHRRKKVSCLWAALLRCDSFMGPLGILTTRF